MFMRPIFNLVFVCFSLFAIAQQTDYVDFQQADISIEIDPQAKQLSGSVNYKLEIVKPTDSIFIDATNMHIDKVLLNGKGIPFIYTDDKIHLKRKWDASTTHDLSIHYWTNPLKAMYFMSDVRGEVDQVWTQGQGKNSSHWVPTIDDMNEKMKFDILINAPAEYEVIANGRLQRKGLKDDGTTYWYYDMNAPMSSYLLAIVLGEYEKSTLASRSGIPLEFYYYPGDSLNIEPTYRYTQTIFNFFESEIGVPYPWQNYKQIPVRDFLYAGMENTGTTIFSDEFVTDSIAFNDRNYVNINAHELAHQWFGNLVTEVSGTHHWLHEGFASYYALLAERMIHGDDHFYWKLYESALKLEQQDLNGSSTALLDPKSSSLTFYEKGAWTLFMLRELVGDSVFKKAVQTYLNDHAFRNVTTQDFMGYVEDIGDIDLTAFAYEWLRNDDFPIDRALDALKQNSTFIQEYLMVDCELKNSKCAYYLNSGVSDKAKIKIIEQLPELIQKDHFNSSLEVRQAIATHLTTIPKNLKPLYETLLNDASYKTKEAALYNLWVNFPDDRIKYLKETRSIRGFNDYNVRMLWLVLNLNTPDFEPENKSIALKELTAFSGRSYSPQTRVNAFNYLKAIGACGQECKLNLEDAVSHHFWRLSKFAKETLLELNKE